MDPTQLAQLQQLQQMYGQGGPPQQGRAFQPQAFQVQNRPLAPAGGGGGQAAPAQAGAAPGGGGGQQQEGGGGGGWAQTLLPLMKGMQGLGRSPPPGAGVIPPVQSGIGGQMPAAPNVGPGTVQGPVPNGIVNSWPYAR